MNPDSSPASAIEVVGLTKRYGTGKPAVDNVNLRIARGSYCCLLGPSGCGKSTTLRMIAGVIAPDRGRIVLNGRVLFDRAAAHNLSAAQRKIGVVFQDYALFPRMTVAENVGFGLHSMPAPQRRQRVQRQLERMHIAELAERMPGEISGGQRQRVAIARCMARLETAGSLG